MNILFWKTPLIFETAWFHLLTLLEYFVSIIYMIPQEILKLNPAERLQWVEDIWDSLTDLPDSIPVTPAQRAELDRRLEKYRDDPHGAIPWDEVKRRILNQE